MAIRIVHYTSEYEEAARAFNERMRRGGQEGFLLPDTAPPEADPTKAIRAVYHVALEGDSVRGGFVLCKYPAWLSGEMITATDCIAPLSEGIVDPKYGMLAMHFVKYLQQQTPYGFAVGMGSEGNAYPRLLRAAGWRTVTTPFFFRVFRAGRFLRELRLLRRSFARRTAAVIGAATGVGAAAMAALQWHAVSTRLSARGLSLERPAAWGGWADTIWDQFKSTCSFTTMRDASTLKDFYSPDDPSVLRFLVRQKGRPVAWAAALNTRMRNDQYFGDLQVATILDCVGERPLLAAAVDLVSRELANRGADLVLSNQTHTVMQAAFARAGFQRGPSNYVLGISKAIAERLRDGGGEGALHITRGDGDGRMHL